MKFKFSLSVYQNIIILRGGGGSNDQQPTTPNVSQIFPKNDQLVVGRIGRLRG
ncbi:MAG: hypothetical protein GY820_01300 [Gammaproteobacteria bacterium]|nr:hypothetical protein [Gammaproteobacteria bacterium]